MTMRRIKTSLRDALHTIRNFFMLLRYPFWAMHDCKGKRLPIDYTWYDCIPEGWRKAFGKRLSRDVVKAYVECVGSKKGIESHVNICDVKEKYGELRIYASGPGSVLDVFEKYLKESWDHCFYCGRKADWQTTGWILPVCERHKNENSIRK